MKNVAIFFGVALTVLVAACSSSTGGSSSGASGGTPQGCVAQCQASGGSGQQVCGTDKQTYDGCAWDCGQVPKGVSTFPGACQADGAPAADAPKDPADGDIICDYIKVGAEWQAVECIDDLSETFADGAAYLDGKDGNDFVTAAAVRPGDLHILAGDPPAEVDHRARYGAVKAQGSVSSCTAFAMAAALEGSIAATIGQKVQLSEMHLWSRYFTPGVAECVGALDKGGIASIADANANGLPYDEKLAGDWEKKASKPDAALVSKADALAQFQVARVDPIGAPPAKPKAEQLQKALVEGLDLWVAMDTSDNWGSPQNGVVADYASSGKGGHAVLVVGYKQIDGKPYFIFRNSWGQWADGGYGYISFKTMEDNIHIAAAIGIKRKDGAATPTCTDGQSADLAGNCRKICDDKTLADEAGNCGPVAVTCPAGQTADASGTCVASCKAGDSTGQGYKASCSDRACTWTIDPGGPGCAAGGAACTQSCPAPTCAVVSKKNELGQTIVACAAPNQ